MRALLVAAAGFLLGCAASPTNDRACGDLARALCARLSACSPHSIAFRYGDVAGCEAAQSQACLALIAAPGSSASASFEAGCALALPSESCVALFGNAPLYACVAPPGRLHDGDACLGDAQCPTGTCNRAPTADAGTCGTPARSGEACATRSCARGLVCAGPTPACVSPGVKDAACDDAHPCAIGFSCVGASAMLMGSCQPAIATLGADCDPDAASSAACDLDQQLVCDPASKTCVAETP